MAPVPADVEWIAVDWGTTNMRAFAIAGDSVLDRIDAPLGMGGLEPRQFEPALLSVVSPWLETGRRKSVVACGMVGARQGWVEVPYLPAPAPPLDAAAMRDVATADPRISVTIVHGMSQAEPADVMRGEETQIAGLLALRPGFAGLLCLPGTHAKWARVEAGRVLSFTTFMTGEIFSLVASQSILRHSLAGSDDTDGAAFDAAVAMAAGDPASLAAHLFGTRPAGLLGSLGPSQARGRISGLLIGQEVAAMRGAWMGERVALIGASALSARYRQALEGLGCRDVETLDSAACTVAGLVAARRLLETARRS